MIEHACAEFHDLPDSTRARCMHLSAFSAYSAEAEACEQPDQLACLHTLMDVALAVPPASDVFGSPMPREEWHPTYVSIQSDVQLGFGGDRSLCNIFDIDALLASLLWHRVTAGDHTVTIFQQLRAKAFEPRLERSRNDGLRVYSKLPGDVSSQSAALLVWDCCVRANSLAGGLVDPLQTEVPGASRMPPSASSPAA